MTCCCCTTIASRRPGLLWLLRSSCLCSSKSEALRILSMSENLEDPLVARTTCARCSRLNPYFRINRCPKTDWGKIGLGFTWPISRVPNICCIFFWAWAQSCSYPPRVPKALRRELVWDLAVPRADWPSSPCRPTSGGSASSAGLADWLPATDAPEAGAGSGVFPSCSDWEASESVCSTSLSCSFTEGGWDPLVFLRFTLTSSPSWLIKVSTLASCVLKRLAKAVAPSPLRLFKENRNSSMLSCSSVSGRNL